MKTVLMEVLCGTSIDLACQDAVQKAVDGKCRVKFNFNGTDMLAEPSSDPVELRHLWQVRRDKAQKAYKESPAGIAVGKARHDRLVKAQETLSALIKRLPGLCNLPDGPMKLDMIMTWLANLADIGDDRGLDWNKAAALKTGGMEWICVLLTTAGFKENDLVGDPPESFATRTRMGKYIAGQVMNCLRHGMSPHPVTSGFVEKYFNCSAELEPKQ